MDNSKELVTAVATAFAAGAIAGWRRGGRRMRVVETPTRGRVAAFVISMAGAIAMRVVREVAMQQLTKFARAHWSANEPAHA